MADANTNVEASSHKGQKLTSYTSRVKIQAVQYVETNTNSATTRKFNVDDKTH